MSFFFSSGFLLFLFSFSRPKEENGETHPAVELGQVRGPEEQPSVPPGLRGDAEEVTPRVAGGRS